ncbi:MAG: hypothetical protein ACR2P2_13045 [Nakamurella sp.]
MDGPPFDGKKAKYYRVPMTAGMTPWAAATIIGRNDDKGINGLDVSAQWVNQDGEDCFSGDLVHAFGSDNGIAPISTVALQPTPYGAGWPAECRGANTVYLGVWRSGDHARASTLPVEIIIRQEPAAVTKGLPAPAVKGALPAVPTTVAKRAATSGGPDLNSAPELVPGITYTDSITTTENRFYKVRLKWGQQLSVRMVPTGSSADSQHLALASIYLLNPMRVALGAFLSRPGAEVGFWGGRDGLPAGGRHPLPSPLHQPRLEDLGGETVCAGRVLLRPPDHAASYIQGQVDLYRAVHHHGGNAGEDRGGPDLLGAEVGQRCQCRSKGHGQHPDYPRHQHLGR